MPCSIISECRYIEFKLRTRRQQLTGNNATKCYVNLATYSSSNSDKTIYFYFLEGNRTNYEETPIQQSNEALSKFTPNLTPKRRSTSNYHKKYPKIWKNPNKIHLPTLKHTIH